MAACMDEGRWRVEATVPLPVGHREGGTERADVKKKRVINQNAEIDTRGILSVRPPQGLLLGRAIVR